MKKSKYLIALLLTLCLSFLNLSTELTDYFTDSVGISVHTEAFAASKSKKEEKLPLIIDSSKVDYMSYVPKLSADKDIKNALSIKNPDISIEASSAILFNAATGEVLYYKDPVIPVFPSSTAKLLTALVALDWCEMDEEITVGSEIGLIAYDSSKANLRKGEILSVSDLLEAMLLPSGNDAAYVMAAYVGRKSLNNKKAKDINAVKEFVKLMNSKAMELGVRNSCFITPDGYDAIGQYTTAYDMGMIGLAAVKNKTILSITKKASSTNKLISGETITWNNTNNLINKRSSWYYSKSIGLKTGTTTMAGKCLISAAKSDDDTVVCIVMHSTSEGRWKDSIKLLKYGLKTCSSSKNK
jgi:D-alanyl-D-alanine carboxypeptidase (penicillin-binding protein 5/6)